MIRLKRSLIKLDNLITIDMIFLKMTVLNPVAHTNVKVVQFIKDKYKVKKEMEEEK